MVTCYEDKLSDWYNNNAESRPTLDGTAYPGLSSWQLEMLMKWAANDPVSEKETARLNAVYTIQQNRNPFIDYPGLERFIWGDLKDASFSYDNYSATSIVEKRIEANRPETVYTTDGKQLNRLQKGINILRSKDGKVRKVMR